MVRKLLCGALIGVLLIATGLLPLSCSSMGHSPELWQRFLDTYPEDEAKTLIWESPPSMIIDTSKNYTATIEMEKGNLVLELFAKDAPVTVNYFVTLALAGFYDGLTFERVIMGYIAQSSDPAEIYGSPAYAIPAEITEKSHVTGALSMVYWPESDPGGSQFFICYDDLLYFDGQYSVFGHLKGGWDLFIKLTPRDPMEHPQFEGDKIIRVIITEE